MCLPSRLYQVSTARCINLGGEDNVLYPVLSRLYFFVIAVAPFKMEFISENILQRLIKQNVIVCFRLTDPSSSECLLYRSGKQCDYFIMILQGRVQVEFGKETLIFEGGPFVYFGVQALGMVFLQIEIVFLYRTYRRRYCLL